MFKNTLNSFTNNISQKIKNPFLGTFIIVWITRNWQFVYSLFNFDSKTNRESRLAIIKEFFKDYGIVEILVTIGYSLLVLVATYVFLNFSRLIVDFFQEIVTPRISKLFNESNIVTREKYNILDTQVNQLETKFNKERESRLKAQNETESLETRVKELLDKETRLNNSIEEQINLRGIVEKENQELKEASKDLKKSKDLLLKTHKEHETLKEEIKKLESKNGIAIKNILKEKELRDEAEQANKPLEEKIKDLERKLEIANINIEDERTFREEAERKYLTLKGEIHDLRSQEVEITDNLNKERSLKSKAQKDNENLKERIKELQSQENKTSNTVEKEYNSTEKRSQLVFEKLVDEKKIDLFMGAASEILSDIPQKKNASIQEFTLLGLIIPGKEGYPNDTFNYTLTNLGKVIINKSIIPNTKK